MRHRPTFHLVICHSFATLVEIVIQQQWMWICNGVMSVREEGTVAVGHLRCFIQKMK